MIKFIFKKEYDTIEIFINDMKIDDFNISSCCSEDEILKVCQKWLDDREINDIEYKIYIEIH